MSNYIDMTSAELAAEILEAVKEEREACAKIADQNAVDFLSPEYATSQPMSSLGERCANCGRGDWPGVSKTGLVWGDTVRCQLDDGLKAVNYLCKSYVKMTPKLTS